MAACGGIPLVFFCVYVGGRDMPFIERALLSNEKAIRCKLRVNLITLMRYIGCFK